MFPSTCPCCGEYFTSYYGSEEEYTVHTVAECRRPNCHTRLSHWCDREERKEEIEEIKKWAAERKAKWDAEEHRTWIIDRKLCVEIGDDGTVWMCAPREDGTKHIEVRLTDEEVRKLADVLNSHVKKERSRGKTPPNLFAFYIVNQRIITMCATSVPVPLR